MSKQSDAALREDLKDIIRAIGATFYFEGGEYTEAEYNEKIDSIIALFTQAKNDLLQELLEQKQDLIFSNGIRQEAVPVDTIEKYLAEGDSDE